GSNDFMRF
uniref:FMRFamide-7 n=1 Tax=Sarcophaga bullata TaxID=7385 RepID=FAR7_SARBU|nr:RecName: Full=FMRFamide-7; AltName: Full=SabFMRFamide-7 [Sarcophaga bullata]